MCYDKNSPVTNLDKLNNSQRLLISSNRATIRTRLGQFRKMSQEDQFSFRRAEKADIKAVRELIQVGIMVNAIYLHRPN